MKRHAFSSLVAVLAAGVSLTLAGCWMAAAQFAPMLASAAEGVGEGAVSLTSGIGASVTAESTQKKKREEARENAMNSDDSCEQLSVEMPGVIELRRSASGTPEYRELLVNDALAQKQWVPIADSETTADGWQPAVNFLQMNFTPPLGAVVPETSSSYLAYAPSKYVTAADSDRLTAMTSNFGKPTGTFMWKGNYYHYVVTSTLPCFPPPPAPLVTDATAPRGS